MDRNIKGLLWRAYACVYVCLCAHKNMCKGLCSPVGSIEVSIYMLLVEMSVLMWLVCVCVLATAMQLMIVSPVCCFFFWSQCVCSYVWSRVLIRFPCVSVRINVNNRMWAIHTVIPTLSLWGQASLCLYRVTQCVCVSMWGRQSKNNS